MHPDEGRQYILHNVKVTRQKITLAKGFILKQPVAPKGRTDDLINAFIQSVDAVLPAQFVFDPNVEPYPELKRVAEAFSWHLAACEAVWELIHASLLIPVTSTLDERPLRLSYTTGRYSSGWRFEELSVPVIDRVRVPPSHFTEAPQILVDPDLFLHEIAIPDLDAEVDAALREAVQCLRHDLYTACLAMLGKASEGAWIELGLALVQALPGCGTTEKEPKVATMLRDPFVGVAKKIQEIIKLYERQDVLKPVADRSSIKVQELRNVAIWADTVRESRNSVHYGAEPAMRNSYEKVATLLIAAVPHFRILYGIRRAANAVVAERSR